MHARCQVSRLQCLRPDLRHKAASPSRIDHRHGFHTTSSKHRAVRTASTIDSLYTDSQPPTAAHLDAAKAFFTTHEPTKSWTAEEWRTTSVHTPETPSLVPEIAFIGRSNTGKSSLLNALLSHTHPPLCRVGSKPGKTTLMHAWSLTPTPRSRANPRPKPTDLEPKLTLLDMPGYGHGSHQDWGDAITKYLTRRRQLRRAFVLINPSHGLKDSDLMTLDMLHAHGISHQVVACKCDRLKSVIVPYALASIRDAITKHFTPKGKGQFSLITLRDVLAVGALGDGAFNAKVEVEKMKGIDHVRWAVIRAAGLEDYALHLAGHSTEPKSTAANPTIQPPVHSVLSELNMTPTQEQHKQHQPAPIGYSVADFLSLPAKLPEQPKGARAETMTPYAGTRMNPTRCAHQPSKPQPTQPPSPNVGIGIDALQSMTQPTTSTSKPKPPNVGVGLEALQSMIQPTRPKAPSVGIGIDALLEMTQPKPKEQPKKKQKKKKQQKQTQTPEPPLRKHESAGGRQRPGLRQSHEILRQAQGLIART